MILDIRIYDISIDIKLVNEISIPKDVSRVCFF